MKTLLHKNNLLLLLFLIAFANQLMAQNGIVSISPSQTDAGTTVSATITLDSNATPPLPPSNAQPTSVVIGTIAATSFQRTDETTVTASFDIPSGMASGSYDVKVSFEPPKGTVTYTLSGGFQVGSGSSGITKQTMGLFINKSSAYSGYTLFAPMSYNAVYLIDMNGELVHSWQTSTNPALSVYLLENGHLVQTGSNGSSPFKGTGGAGGVINEYDWDGNLVWTYNYSSSTYCSHHDVEVLPNGDYLIIAWELKSKAEAIQAGRDSTTITDGELWPDKIIEVKPDYETGSGGTIVWEWHIWDHLIQDYDSSKNNYGVVADHPELININYAEPRQGSYSADWTHLNSVEYIKDYDQILLSSHAFSEIWIIDHSTTTAEAASHAGGTYGKGGDLLYRWGNPQTYDSGSSSDQKLFSQHNPSWIESGYPGSGDILVFNNGFNRTGGTNYSSVDEIVPPDNGSGTYSMSGSTYGPSSTTWQFKANPVTDFYSANISGAQRLPNGNTLICNGNYGSFCEVTESGDTVWYYINPVTNGGPLTQGETIPDANQGVGTANTVFRCTRYATDYAAFTGRDLTPQGTIEGESSGTITGDVIYIDSANGSDSNSGDSWAKAKKTITSGIEVAKSAKVSEIWVKAGTYYTTTGTDRSASFTLPDNMAIYGGFAGTESSVDERTNYGSDEANETILSGDIGTQGTNTDNTYRIMITGKNCTVDGFTFTKAYANGEFTKRMGGAIYLANDASVVKNCHFENNYAESGGAMYVFNINGDGTTSYQTVTISNCSFSNNEANLGGAIVFRVGASTNMTSCTFENNDAKWRGGAVFIDYGAYQNYPIVIDSCAFTGNSCEGNGGAIYTDDMASQLQGTYYTISNCSFTSNTTTYRGGAICTYNTNNYPNIENNTFISNSGGLSGNAIAGDNGPNLTINNNTFNSGQDINLDEDCNCSGTDCPQ